MSHLILLSLPIYTRQHSLSFFFFFNDTATTEIYTLSLHDALPIYIDLDDFEARGESGRATELEHVVEASADREEDRKSTRLNSSHGYISYAVFCLKKKKRKAYHAQSS